VCSGIASDSYAWEKAGLDWQCKWYCELAAAPSKVLKAHYPNVPNLKDITDVSKKTPGFCNVDLVVGGTPCQAFSLGGKRLGITDDEKGGNLALKMFRLAKEAEARWILWENVPGVLSSNSGEVFRVLLSELGELGYGWAYRVLDTQDFGLPQERRRVILVAHAGGDFRKAGRVLFEREAPHNDHPRGDSKARSIPILTCNSAGNSNARGVVVAKDIDLDRGRLFGQLYKAWSVQKEAGEKGQAEKTFKKAIKEIENNPPKIIFRNLSPFQEERRQGLPGNHTEVLEGADAYKCIGNSMPADLIGWVGVGIDLQEKLDSKRL
jgi:DNA (cytosine-5)-methyltransferase 1